MGAMTPADLARAAIAAADAVEEAWDTDVPCKQWDELVEDAVDDLVDARLDARAAGLVECWLRRETVEAVRLARVLHQEPATQTRAVELVARDLDAGEVQP